MKSNRVLTAIAVMAATIMQVLDTTIINVALPNMAGQLDATPDNIGWVLTSYLVAAAIFMPLTGFFTDRLGQKRYLLISIAGFVAASALCGMATSLAQMVLFRFLQGVFGASLVPLSQSIMLQVYPGEQRGKAMAIWAMGVMVAPIMGPTLGGWLTDMISWRWTFYINLPVGIVSFLLALRHVPTTEVKERQIDWVGFASLAVGIGALQLVLDRGNQDDWFTSQLIVTSSIASALSFVFFIAYTVTGKHHALFDLRIFKDRNYLMASFIISATSIGFYGGLLLQSLYLQNYLGYPTFDAGLYMAPRGIASFVVMIVVGKFSGRIPARQFIFAGICFSVIGNFVMTRFTGDITGQDLILPTIFQGLGMGLIFVPVSNIAFASLPREAAAEAAGIFSLIRSVGSSFGIAIVATYLSRSTQQSWSLLRGSVVPYSDALQGYLAPLHLGVHDPLGIAIVAKAVLRQAQGLAYIDTFWFATMNFLLIMPLLLFVKTPKKDRPSGTQVSPE